MKTYKIVKKLNYKQESVSARVRVDTLCATLSERLNQMGWAPQEQHPQVVFSIGGDGTMMHTMHEHLGALVVGINAGNVGFLTPFEVCDMESLYTLLETYDAGGSVRIEQRAVIQGELLQEGQEPVRSLAVNEFAISGCGPNEMLPVSLSVVHKEQRSAAGLYRSNALVVSGPCGSTAYNMNAGGAIVDPSVACMQLVLVAPTTLGARPLIVGKNSTIEVSMQKRSHVYVDGMLLRECEAGARLHIRLLQEEVQLLVPSEWNFYGMLSQKLHWNNGVAP